MEYIDKHSFERYVDKAFSLDSAERNQMYHKVKEMVEGSDDSATEIISLFSQFFEDRKSDIEYKAAEKNEGKEPGAVFRRIG